MADPLVLFDLDSDGIATLTLNRPDKLNAFTMDMLAEWHQHLLRCTDDPAVKFLVLTGAGRAFCAGGDAGAMKKRSGNDALEQKTFLWKHVHPIAMALERLDKPMVAAINGMARGAGLDMALMCDMRFMAASATVAESYINMGLTAGDGGTWFLPRLVGLDRALDLMWTGRVVSSEEALRIGLVTEVVPDSELMTATYAFARRVAAQPMEAIRMCKRATYQGREMALVPHLDMLSSHMSVLRDTPEHRERVAAFIASRKR
jgi:enoyl-CoA hydratase/carnithine racemase